MRIVQTVFGVFHSFDLARELHRRGHLQTIYSTWPWRRLQREAIPHDLVKTFPWIHTPEFLLNRARLLPRWLEDHTGYSNALAFDEYTLRRIGECDALVAISGSALKTGRRVQQRGARFICDRGSSHQRFQEELISDEYRRWNVGRPVSDPRDTAREEEIYATADAITVPSTFARESFLATGTPPDKVELIPYGVNLSRFEQTGTPPADRFEVVFVGSVSLRKGIPYLLRAFAALRHPAKRLRIVGAVSAELRPLLAALPKDDVEFLGALPQPMLKDILSTSHLFVLPSIEDGFGVVIGQAMACGCPALTSTNTGGPDIVTDGVDGFIVPVRDVAGMTERMERLAADPALQRRMSVAALERVKHLGGWQTYGDRWEAFLQRETVAKAKGSAEAL